MNPYGISGLHEVDGPFSMYSKGGVYNNFIPSIEYFLIKHYTIVHDRPTTQYEQYESPLGYTIKVIRANDDFTKGDSKQIEMKLLKPSKSSKKARLVFERDSHREKQYIYDLEEIDANNISWCTKFDNYQSILEIFVPKKPCKSEILQKRKTKKMMKSERKAKSPNKPKPVQTLEETLKECETLLYKGLYNENLNRLELNDDIWSEASTPEASDTE